MIQGGLLLILLSNLVISMMINRDLFSPAKYYHLLFLIFFFDLFLDEQLIMVYFASLIYLSVGFFFVLFEATVLRNAQQFIMKRRTAKALPIKPYLNNEHMVVYLMYFFCGITLIAFAFLIYVQGGLFNYLLNMKTRNVSWKGLSTIIVFMRLSTVLPLFFYSLGLVFGVKKKKRWYISLALVSIVSIVVAALTGSRSTVLYIAFFLLLAYHFLVKPVRIKTAFFALCVLLLAASILGGVRELFSVNQDHNFALNKTQSVMFAPFKTGLKPLDVVYGKTYTNLVYGQTYLTAITNFIPRYFWPNKPPSGGIRLTNFAMGYHYYGTTNYSTGAIAEGIINFGYFFGYFSAIFWLLFAVLLSLSSYKQVILSRTCQFDPWRKHRAVNVYIIVFSFPANLLMGEFTNSVTVLIKRLIFYFFMSYLVRLVAKR